RFVEVEAGRETGEARCRLSAHITTRSLVLQIVAGGKGTVTGAGDDADPEIRIGGELVPHAGELGVRRRVQRVHDFGTVDRDGQNVAVARCLAELAHCSPSHTSMGSKRKLEPPDNGFIARKCRSSSVAISTLPRRPERATR